MIACMERHASGATRGVASRELSARRGRVIRVSIHLVWYCSACGDERAFERPPCLDGHGADCPEYACVDCGYAVFLGAFDVEAEVRILTRNVA